MNRPLLSALVALPVLAATSVLAHAEAPKLDAVRAAKLASDYLAKLGPGAPHIVSVTLEKSALLNGSLSWIVRWSEPVLDQGNREIGVRVKMDGTVAHLVENLEGRKERATKRPILR